MNYTHIVEVLSQEVKEVQDFLDSVGDGTLNTIKTFTVDFNYAGNGNIQVDIKICDGESRPYVDPVIFQDNAEVSSLEVTDTFIGKYEFPELMGNTYTVIIKEIPL